MLHETVHTRLFSEPQDIQVAQPGVDYPDRTARPRSLCGRAHDHGARRHFPACRACFALDGSRQGWADSAVLQLPLDNLETLLLNGVACQPGIVGIYACGAELLRANPQPSSFASLILPFGSVERLLEPPPRSKLLCPGCCALLQAEPAIRARYERIVLAAHEVALSVPDLFMVEQSRLALREALLHASRDLINPDHASETRMPRNCQALRRIVVAADEYLRTAYGQADLYRRALRCSRCLSLVLGRRVPGRFHDKPPPFP